GAVPRTIAAAQPLLARHPARTDVHPWFATTTRVRDAYFFTGAELPPHLWCRGHALVRPRALLRGRGLRFRNRATTHAARTHPSDRVHARSRTRHRWSRRRTQPSRDRYWLRHGDARLRTS